MIAVDLAIGRAIFDANTLFVAIENLVVSNLEGVCPGDGEALLPTAAAGLINAVAIHDDMIAAPHTDAGRGGIVGRVILHCDIAGVENQDAGVVVEWTSIDHAQTGNPNVVLARNFKQACQIVRQNDPTAVYGRRLTRVSGIGDVVIGAT